MARINSGSAVFMETRARWRVPELNRDAK